MKAPRVPRRAQAVTPVESSPLRRVDPRTKLVLCLCLSLGVILPLEQLVFAMGAYILLLVWARLLPAVVRRLWRLKWVLLILFLVDWLVISLDLALVVTLRLVLLAGAFLLFFATTTPGELRRALEWMGVPHRYAFSVSLAFQSVSLLDQEWQTIREAHQARGGWMVPTTGWRNLRERVRDLVALAVPAVVMTAERAWLMTEAAYARGFDSPRRRSYQQLKMRRMDWMLLTGALAASLALVLWRWRM